MMSVNLSARNSNFFDPVTKWFLLAVLFDSRKRKNTLCGVQLGLVHSFRILTGCGNTWLKFPAAFDTDWNTSTTTLKPQGYFRACFLGWMFFKLKQSFTGLDLPFQRKFLEILSIILAPLITDPSKGIHLGITRFLYTHIYVYVKKFVACDLEEILWHF